MGISSSSLRPYTYIKQSLYKQKDKQVVLGVECPNTYFKIPCILEMVLKVARFRMAVAKILKVLFLETPCRSHHQFTLLQSRLHNLLWRKWLEMSRITFEVLKVAVEEVDNVEIGKKSSSVGRQFAEFLLTLVNILWCFIPLLKLLLNLSHKFLT